MSTFATYLTRLVLARFLLLRLRLAAGLATT